MSNGVHIPPNEHVFIGGQTGSGKTFLARKYLAGYRYVVALDTNGNLDLPEIPRDQITIVTRLLNLPNARTPKIIYRPVREELNEAYDNEFFRGVYRRQNTIVWVDEAMSVSPNPLRIPEYYKACLTRGRELGIGVWSLSQRPAKIALEILSESTHFFIFRLNLQEDRKRLREITGA